MIRYSLTILLFATLLIGGLFAPVYAQTDPTATPDAAGNIYIVVQANDTLWHIVGRAGITMDELLALNNITMDHLIHPGDKLIIGRVTPEPTATIPPTVTPTLPPPTPKPTAVAPRATICLTAFMDRDQNGVYNAGEPLRRAVAFTIFNEEQVVANYITDGASEPYCLDRLTPGDYKITRSVGREETLTTAGDWTLTLRQGEQMMLDFGSFTGAEIGSRSAVTPVSVTAVFPTAQPVTAATATAAQADRATAVADATNSAQPTNIIIILLAGIAFALIILAGSLIAIWQYRQKREDQ